MVVEQQQLVERDGLMILNKDEKHPNYRPLHYHPIMTSPNFDF
jgi:hypothetical protein